MFPAPARDTFAWKGPARLSEPRLKIALFIDFDNIEIGVKTTLGGHFDVGAVLEAMKERGEVVTKVAYGDWTRAGDYSRSLTQHAIQMVQRNLTPGGDKNGADINLALDALEMAFTHSHINAFVIVGGDSDFMALVEKLKLYDRQVFVVGGRAFTSVILQKNCTEFIAYENLIGRRGSSSRGGASKDVKDAMPLVKRALKVLADREVMPQLGVLKSTLLQLDSTFSEREYGVSTFRDFVQKLERAQQVNLRGDERSLLVELREGIEVQEPAPPPVVQSAPPQPAPRHTPPPAPAEPLPEPARPADAAAAAQMAEGYAAIRDVFLSSGVVTRWPLYVRQAKQVIRSASEGFDERRFGFNGIVDALRYSQREGLFRLDRDRQGVIRIYPGPLLAEPGESPAPSATEGEGDGSAEPVLPEIFEGTVDPAGPSQPSEAAIASESGPEPRRGERRRRRGGRGGERGGERTEPVVEQTIAEVVQDGELFPHEQRPAADGETMAAASERPSAPPLATRVDAETTVEDVEAVEVIGEDVAPAAGPRKSTRKRAATPRKRAGAVKKTARKRT